MSTNSSSCDRRTLARFLDDQLSDDQQQAVERHLQCCSDCRMELERLAAEESWWSEAPQHLRDGSLDDEDAPRRSDTSRDVLPECVLSFLGPTDHPHMLGRFGGYEVAGVVGHGGMGVVLKGLDPALNRYVAIKVLSPQLAASGPARLRFAREAQAAAAVVHDHVIAIHGVSESGGLPYLVMPYLRGASLQRRLDAHGPLLISETLRIGMQTASGLAAAHAQGLVHRDIKPGNILLAEGVERVKITDFGLARAADDASLTRSGVIAGTPQFMSPEQARGEMVDFRSDLFSLGSVLYTALAGRPPFRAETTYGVLRRICESQPRPLRELSPQTPAWMATLIGQLMEKSPQDRPDSAESVARLMAQCLSHHQQPGTTPLPLELTDLAKGGKPQRAPSRLRRHGLWTGCLAVAGVILIVWWNGQGEGDKSGAASASPTVVEKPDEASVHATELRWDDGVGEEIESLEADTGWLESQYGDLNNPLSSQ